MTPEQQRGRNIFLVAVTIAFLLGAFTQWAITSLSIDITIR